MRRHQGGDLQGGGAGGAGAGGAGERADGGAAEGRHVARRRGEGCGEGGVNVGGKRWRVK